MFATRFRRPTVMVSQISFHRNTPFVTQNLEALARLVIRILRPSTQWTTVTCWERPSVPVCHHRLGCSFPQGKRSDTQRSSCRICKPVVLVSVHKTASTQMAILPLVFFNTNWVETLEIISLMKNATVEISLLGWDNKSFICMVCFGDILFNFLRG